MKPVTFRSFVAELGPTAALAVVVWLVLVVVAMAR